MELLSRKTTQYVTRPVSVLQFGEGNFLRAFVDDFLDILNENNITNIGVCVIQPMSFGRVYELSLQDGLYTVLLEGIENKNIVSTKRIVSSLSDFINPFTELPKYLEYASNPDIKLIISNTTESGISYLEEKITRETTPISFPGKILQLLNERFNKLGTSHILDILCCELIDNNATTLHEVLLKLAKYNNCSPEFINYINLTRYNNSLVDRIVPGFPKEDINRIESENGYIDNSLVKAEPFSLWVIEGSDELKAFLPFEKSDIHAYYVSSIYPYKQQKVKILNGSHTALVPLSYLLNHREVKESINDPLVSKFVNLFIDNEVLPTIALDKEKILSFKNSVIERFQNPFIHHMLMSIALNSISKYEARIIPSILETYEKGVFPKYGLFALVCLMRFYKGVDFNNDLIPLNDDKDTIDYIKSLFITNNYKTIVNGIVSKYYSNYKLFNNPKVIDYLVKNLELIDNNDLRSVLEGIVNE